MLASISTLLLLVRLAGPDPIAAAGPCPDPDRMALDGPGPNNIAPAGPDPTPRCLMHRAAPATAGRSVPRWPPTAGRAGNGVALPCHAVTRSNMFF